jgi:hypothetical protein
MKLKLPLATVALAAVAIFCGATVSAAAVAQAGPTYCLNGVSTTLPVGVAASSESQGDGVVTLWPNIADYILSTSPTGRFYLGWDPTDSPDPGWFFVATTPDDLEPGFSENYLSLGACRSAQAPSLPTHVAVCKYLMRGDGTMGMFQEISVSTWNNPKGQYYDAPAANWVEGLGLTCDNPVHLGYKAAGYNVAWGGKQDLGSDPSGVRASGFNNIYPYFTK